MCDAHSRLACHLFYRVCLCVQSKSFQCGAGDRLIGCPRMRRTVPAIIYLVDVTYVTRSTPDVSDTRYAPRPKPNAVRHSGMNAIGLPYVFVWLILPLPKRDR